MPIIDISQNSYRALVTAAHRQRMSVDRFIQHRFARETVVSDENAAVNAGEVAAAERPPVSARAHAERPVKNVVSECKETRPGRRSKADSSFKALWGRMELTAGTEISTKRGQGFTYEIEGGYLTVRESGTRVPRSQFRKALGQWPATGPSTMRGVYAASVVWAVLAEVLAPGVRGEPGSSRELRRADQGP